MQDQTEDFETTTIQKESAKNLLNYEDGQKERAWISPSPIPRNSVDFKSRLITDAEDFMTNREDHNRNQNKANSDTFQTSMTPFSKKDTRDHNMHKKGLYSESFARPIDRIYTGNNTELKTHEAGGPGKTKSLSINKHNSLELNHLDSLSYTHSPRENQMHSRSFQQIDLKNSLKHKKFNSSQNSFMQLSCRDIDSARTDQAFPDSAHLIPSVHREKIDHQIRPFTASEDKDLYSENELVQYNMPSERNPPSKNQLKALTSKGYKEERKLRKLSHASKEEPHSIRQSMDAPWGLYSSNEIVKNPQQDADWDTLKEEDRYDFNRISQTKARPPQLSQEVLNLTSHKSPLQTPTHSQYHSRKASNSTNAMPNNNSIISHKTLRSPQAVHTHDSGLYNSLPLTADQGSSYDRFENRSLSQAQIPNSGKFSQDHLPEYASSRSQPRSYYQSDGTKRILISDKYQHEDPEDASNRLPNHYFRPTYKKTSETRYHDSERTRLQNEGPVQWISIPSPSNMSYGQQSFKFNVPRDKYSKQLYQSRQSQDSKVLSQEYLRASIISTDMNSPGSQKFSNISRMKNGSVMVPEQVFKLGIMVNVLDKFNSLNRLKLLNQAFQTLNLHQQKFAFNLRQNLLRLMGIAKKRNYMLLAQAFKIWREDRPQNLNSYQRKGFPSKRHDRSSSPINKYQEIPKSRHQPNSSESIAYRQDDSKMFNNFGFLPPHHIRTNSAGHYYMVTSSSDSSQILCKDDLEAIDLTTKLYNSQKHFYDPHRNQEVSRNQKSQQVMGNKKLSEAAFSISHPVNIGPQSAKANRSPRLEFSSYQHQQSMYEENNRSISNQALQSRLEKEKSFEHSSFLNDRKEAALAKFRAERRNRVRTAVAKELAEIKARLELLGAFEKVNTDLNSTFTTNKNILSKM